MGIIKKTGFILLICCAFNLTAQIAPDTVYFSGNNKQRTAFKKKNGNSSTGRPFASFDAYDWRDF